MSEDNEPTTDNSMSEQTTFQGVDFAEKQWVKVVIESVFGEATHFYQTGLGDWQENKFAHRWHDDGRGLETKTAPQLVDDLSGEDPNEIDKAVDDDVKSIEVVEQSEVPQAVLEKAE